MNGRMNGQTDSSYTHDVFPSHNSKDKAVVEQVGAFLESKGVRVWFDQWEIDFGQSIPAKVNQGVANSRYLRWPSQLGVFWRHSGYSRFPGLGKLKEWLPSARTRERNFNSLARELAPSLRSHDENFHPRPDFRQCRRAGSC